MGQPPERSEGLEPESTPNFKRGQRRGLVLALVVAVLFVLGVFLLSTEFWRTRARANPDNKEGCPCGCDHSEAMAAELRSHPGESSLGAIDKSLATIAEREAAGYVTERMIVHRLRLSALRREMSAPRAETVQASTTARAALPVVEDARLRARMELIVHGETTEIVAHQPKRLSACFLVRMEIENLTGRALSLKKPEIAGGVSFPVSRWYEEGSDGEAWDGALKAREGKSIHVIGYVGDPLAPSTKVQAVIRFESLTVHAMTRARARWNQEATVPASMGL